MIQVTDIMMLAADSLGLGRQNERADVLAFLREEAAGKYDEDTARTLCVLADLIEDGAHEGAADRERQREEAEDT